MFKRILHNMHWRDCRIVDRWGIGGNPQRVITRFTCGYRDDRMGNVYDAIGPYNDGVHSNDRCGIDHCLLWIGHDGPDYSGGVAHRV